MKKTLSILFILLISAGFKARADEGMWVLPLIEKLNVGKMTELGLKLTAEDIYSVNKACLKDAIVIFGGGCTGEIVSSQGLILTNHHCGYGSIQSHSTVDHDYLKDGFWAATKEQELPNPELTDILCAGAEVSTSADHMNLIHQMWSARRRYCFEGIGYRPPINVTTG